MMNEADTRANLVEPKLKAAGWTSTQVTREFYYQRDRQYTQGRIILIGNRIRRGEPRKADYLLRYTDGLPIAAVEAEPESKTAESGLEQAKGYAKDLGLAFTYSTNGHSIIEYDYFMQKRGASPFSFCLCGRRWSPSGKWHFLVESALALGPEYYTLYRERRNPH